MCCRSNARIGQSQAINRSVSANIAQRGHFHSIIESSSLRFLTQLHDHWIGFVVARNRISFLRG